MKVRKIVIHRMSGALRRRFGWSLNWAGQRAGTLVSVETDTGLTGWGDGAVLEPERLRCALDRSPFEAEAIFEELRGPAALQGRPGVTMCGSLDVALWDLQGQALGLPVHKLLGPSYRNRVRPYLTALYRVDAADLPAALAEEAAGWVQRGFQTLKMKIGYGPSLDLRCVEAVRKAIGSEIGLAVDSNCAYDVGTAVALGAQLERFDLRWWEEPLVADDLAGYDRLRQSVRIPIATGETCSADALARDFIAPRRVDIVQPEVEWIGLTGARRLTALAWSHHVRILPHNWNTAVRTATVLHWCASMPAPEIGLATGDVSFELDQTEHPFRDVASLPMDAGGFLAVPQGPGLGIQVDRERVEAFTQERIEIV